MKKLLFLLLIWIYPIVSFSAINECKTDVYFANGILTTPRQALSNTDKVLKPAIITKLGINQYNKKIGKVAYAYNNTHGFALDGIETFLQKFGWQGLVDEMVDTSHGRDLTKQIKDYKASITSGNRVLVVAHSQGNLFTREAYNALDECMQDSFEAVSVASPMSASIKENTPRITWDNDIVGLLASLTKC